MLAIKPSKHLVLMLGILLVLPHNGRFLSTYAFADYCPFDPNFSLEEYEESWSIEKLMTEFGPAPDGGVTSQIVLRNADLVGKVTSHTEIGNIVELEYTVIYHGGKAQNPGDPINVRFRVFVNEQIIPLEFNGNDYVDVQLAENVGEIIRVKLPPFDDGIYDIVIAGIPNFELPPQGVAGLREPANVSHFMRRTTLIVGEGSSQTKMSQREYQILKVTETFSRERRAQLSESYPVSYTLIPTLTEQPYWWVFEDLWHKVTQGETYQFNLLTQYQHYAFESESLREEGILNFALIGFQNDTLLPLGVDNHVFYGQVTDEAAQAAIPISLSAPEEQGQYNLTFFKIDYPGVPMCYLALSNTEGTEGLRIAIEVTSP